MSSQYNNNIAEAIDILLNKRLSELHYDQTIIAEIYEIVDSAAGKYKILYESVVLDAESTDPSKKYRVNRSVYVKVPKSDFNEKLLIESAVDSEDTLTGVALKELKNFRVPIFPEFTYSDTMSLVAGPTTLADGSVNPQEKTISYFQNFENETELQFKNLAKEYEVLKLEATFYNSLLNVHTQGNYGLKFNFLTAETEEDGYIQTYKLDTFDFSGNIYGYNTFGTKQSIYLQIPKGALKALKSITFFQENMEQDKNLNSPIMVNDEVVGYAPVTTANLSVSDIKITFYSIEDLTEEKMYLHLIAPKGYYGSELEFEAQLLSEGENIIDEAEYSTFWYKKNLETDIKSFAGKGWEPVTETPTYRLKIDNINILTLYKVLVLNSKKEVVVEKEFQVSPNLDYKLPSVIQSSSSGEIQLSMPEGYNAHWFVEGKDRGVSESIRLTFEDFLSSTSIKIEYNVYKNTEFFTFSSSPTLHFVFRIPLLLKSF